MTKVFIGGSRHASRLDAEILRRIDNVIDKELPIVVGDANGADKAVQQYLHGKRYQDVEVFCSEGICRNNVGNWRTRNIPATTSLHDAQFYSAKDRAMAVEATVGLMVWDGKSLGTLLNVFRLLRLQKKAVIYIVPEKRFQQFSGLAEWGRFLAGLELSLRRKVEQRTKLEISPATSALQTSLLD